MLIVVIEEPVLKAREGKIVARFAAFLDRLLMDGAFAVYQLFLGLERLTALAVKSLVRALVDVAVVVDRLDELPAALVVARVARLDEIVVADLQGLPDFLELA